MAVSFVAALKGLVDRRPMRGPSLPWHDLEAEAARQGCSPADIFFDRAGHGDPCVAERAAASEAPLGGVDEGEPRARLSPRAAWRGYDPLPAQRTG